MYPETCVRVTALWGKFRIIGQYRAELGKKDERINYSMTQPHDKI